MRRYAKRFWFVFNSLSTRARLMALLFLIIVPFLVLLVYNTVDRYRLVQASAKDQSLHLAQMTASKQDDIVAQTRQLLETLANDPSIQSQNWTQCNTVVQSFYQHFKKTYSNFHVANAAGDVLCSAIPQNTKVNIADRKDFQEAVASRRFTVSALVHSRTTGLTSMMTRYPVEDDHGKVFAVVTAQVSIEQFERAAAAIPLHDSDELVVIDRNGDIVLNRPASVSWAGLHMPDGPLLNAMSTQSGGIVESTGLDGVPRIYGFAQAGPGGIDGIRVAIGFPLSVIRDEAKRYLYPNIAIVLAVVVSVLALAWFGVEALVLRKVSVLVNTVKKLKEGETSARTGIVYGADELSLIARAIDETAEELERILTLLREQSVRDPLTQLYNRRYLDDILHRELTTAKRRGWQVGVILGDIDHFKQINDRFGHATGDKVLVSIASTLVEGVRGSDIVCRFGGEEFIIVLPGASLEIARSRAEAIRAAISDIGAGDEGKDRYRVTISLGVSSYPANGQDAVSLLREADIALYKAKNNGRNQVAVAEQAPVV